MVFRSFRSVEKAAQGFTTWAVFVFWVLAVYLGGHHQEPNVYTAEEKAKILEDLFRHVSGGGTVREFCRRDGMPSFQGVYDWIQADEALSGRFARARHSGFDAMADECIEIAGRPSPTTMSGGTDSGDVQHRKLQIETRLKLLARWDPKRYGERVAVDHSGVIGSKKPRNLGSLSTEELATLEALEAKATESEE